MIAAAKGKEEYKYRRILSKQFRFRKGLTKEQRRGYRKALLSWINQPKFRNRRPAETELVAEFLRKNGPLYGMVETEPREAARSYWYERAQYILRHVHTVKVNVVISKQVSQPILTYVPIKRGRFGRIDNQDYIPVKRVMDEPDLRATVLENAHRDLLTWFARYERYAEFLEESIVDAYKLLEAELRKKGVRA